MIGTTLGPYRIDRELGAGGMGRVYAAVVEGDSPGLAPGTRVALKVVHPHLLEAPGFFERFQREGQIGKTVRHDNVVRTLDCDEIGTAHFLVMEYVEGQTLRALLQELERVPEELCRHVGRELCKGLAAIHEAGVLHRDVKPENALITPDQVVKVMDLGVARLQDEAQRLSQSGAFVGSILYAAPESFRGRDVDARADLHALGVLLYELACGVNPNFADSLPEILERVLHGEPRRLGDVNPQLSAFFEELVHCLMAKAPDQRFASARELLDTLEDGEESAWWTARARSLRAESKRPLRRIRIPRETAVYGRDKELGRLREQFASAKAGDGRVVLIEGEAGIGKSRLVDELVGRLQSEGEDLNFLFGSYPPGGAASAAGAFSTAFHEQLGDDGAPPYLPQTPLLAPAFAALLSGDATPPGAEPLTKDSLVTCFVQASRALAAERPTVILIDDLHFAPEEALALFSALALAVPGHRLLLIGTMRPGVAGDWRGNLQRFDHVSQMQVERLFPKDLIALLRDSFRSEALASSLAAQIAVKSDGNPFFAFEIIRGLREGQFITQTDDGTWVSTRAIDQIEIPSSVLDLVNARVADLTEEERDLLDVACCCGFEFDPLLVGEVLGLSRIPLLKRLGQIERQHRLVRSAGLRYVFDHHQVQEALNASLSELLCREYHAALGEALETRTNALATDPADLDGAVALQLCEHFLAGDRGAQALRYLTGAVEHLRKGYLQAEMAALMERALAVPGLLTGVERARVLMRLARGNGPLDMLAHRQRQEEATREALELAAAAGDEALRCDAQRALGWCLYRTARHAEAEAAYSDALESARARGDRESAGTCSASLGVIQYAQGRYAEATANYELCLEICRETGDRLAEARANGNLGNVYWSQGRLAEAREKYELHIEFSRELGNRPSEAIATGNLGNVCWSEGRLAEAREMYERSLAMHREIGSRHGEIAATGHMGHACASEGRTVEARRWFDRHLALSLELGQRDGAALAHYNLGETASELGESATAEDHLRASVALSRQITNRPLEASAHLALGTLLAERATAESGDARTVAAARESLLAARDLARAIGSPGDETLACCALALLPGGDTREALGVFATHEPHLDAQDRREARLLLHKLTGEREHIEHAKRLLDESVAQVDEDTRHTILTNKRTSREILAAWEAAR